MRLLFFFFFGNEYIHSSQYQQRFILFYIRKSLVHLQRFILICANLTRWLWILYVQYSHVSVCMFVCVCVSSGTLQIPADTNKGACSTDQRALHICSPHGAVFPNLIRRACLYVDCQSQASLWRSHLSAEVPKTDRWAKIQNRLVVKPGELPCRFLECGNVLDVSVSWLEWRARVCSRKLCLCSVPLSDVASH